MTKTRTRGAGGASGAGGAGGARRKTAEGRRTNATAPKAPRLPKAVAAVVNAARDKKAIDIVVLDLRKADGFTDYFVVCTGANTRQIGAIADAVRETLKRDLGERPALVEGLNDSEWILLDYFNFIVHVFSRECRAFFDLERLWGKATRYEIGEEVVS